MKFSWKKNTEPARTEPAAQIIPGQEAVPCMDYEYKVYSISETGPTRISNEDAVCSAYPDGSYQCLFAMVADGMGGHNAGEVASAMACDVLKGWVQHRYNMPDSAQMLCEGVQEAHAVIQQESAVNEARKGMGTTATTLFIRDSTAWFAHVGDSRIYHASGGQWQQLTTDHTLVNQMVTNGEITAEEAAAHPMKNYITQAVGYTATIVPQTAPAGIPVGAGDRFLLLSDGVYDVLSGDELGALIPITRPDLLLECISTLCTVRKSSDNFSVVLITVSDERFPLPSVTKEQNALL